MRSFCETMHGLKPVLAMILAQTGYAGVNVFYKLAANDGMGLKIIVAYRFLFASLFIVPFAFFAERKTRPETSWKVLIQAFFCGLFGGALAQNLYVASLVLTSATFAAAMGNLAPAITFIMAVSFGIEKLGIRTISGKVKVLGTVLGITGAMVLTFYKGVELNIWPFHVDLLHKNGHAALSSTSSSSSSSNNNVSNNHLTGAILAFASCLCYAIWLIIQAKMCKEYPCHYSSTALMCMFGSIQAVTYAFFTEDFSQWRLGWNIRLLTVSYSGIVATGMLNAVIALCVRLRGPLFVSVFSPLMLVLVALASSLLLDEKLHLGSVIGGALIVSGLYLVLLGKGKEMKMKMKLRQLLPSTGSNTIDIIIIEDDELNQENEGNVINNKENNEIVDNLSENGVDKANMIEKINIIYASLVPE